MAATQGKLCSETTTFFFVLQNQLRKQFTAESWTSGVDFSTVILKLFQLVAH